MRIFPHKGKAAAIILVLAMGIAGCAKVAPRAALAVEGKRTPEAAALEARLAKLKAATPTLKGLAWVALTTPEEDRRTEAALVVERPDRIRIDAMDALADVWAEAGSDGKKLWLYLPGRQKLYEGRASPRTLRKLAGFDWEPAELVSIVAGLPPLGEAPELLQVGAARERHFASKASGIHLWTDGAKGRVARCIRFAPDGTAHDYEITFSDYHRERGVDFPRRIEAVFPVHEDRILVEYRDVRVGEPVDADAFRSPSGRGAKTVKVRDE